MATAVRVRKSVPLTADDERGVESLRVDVVWRQAAAEIAGVQISTEPSEAEALHALIEIGRMVVEERVNEKLMESGYAALADAQTDEDHAIARATGRRTSARLATDD